MERERERGRERGRERARERPHVCVCSCDFLHYLSFLEGGGNPGGVSSSSSGDNGANDALKAAAA